MTDKPSPEPEAMERWTAQRKAAIAPAEGSAHCVLRSRPWAKLPGNAKNPAVRQGFAI
jgi:hypothetical protein